MRAAYDFKIGWPAIDLDQSFELRISVRDRLSAPKSRVRRQWQTI
jgi:hypothetical protein